MSAAPVTPACAAAAAGAPIRAHGRPLAWLVWLAAGAALGALPAAAAWLAAHGPGPPCALLALIGVPCPTCGLTHALGALAAGDWRRSLALHPWALLLALQLAAGWALHALWLAGRLRVRPDRWLPRAVLVNAAALTVLWLARLVARM